MDPVGRAAHTPASGQICTQCQRESPPYVRCMAPLLYADQPGQWVQRLKFHNGMVEGRLLAAILAAAVSRAYAVRELPDLLVPVPLTLRRLARRGHNQALTLALTVGRMVRRPVRRYAARRTDHGPSQRTLDRAARRRALIHAFTSRAWNGERLAIIDDVMTTGTTAAELARALLAAGAGEVHVWCATRTAPPRDRAIDPPDLRN